MFVASGSARIPKKLEILNPSTEEKMGDVLCGDLDTEAALAFARDVGGPALRAMSFAERGQLLLDMSSVIHGAREELFTLAMKNGGNTRKRRKIRCGWCLADHGVLWKSGTRFGTSGISLMGRTSHSVGTLDCARHIWTPREGVAVHVNAFNFPAWGFAEKAATTLLAGMPLLVKPATSTSLVAFRIMELLVESGKNACGCGFHADRRGA